MKITQMSLACDELSLHAAAVCSEGGKIMTLTPLTPGESALYFCFREDGIFVIGLMPSEKPNIGLGPKTARSLAQFILKNTGKKK